MTNTGKLLIVGLLVIDAGIAGYLLVPKDEERTPTTANEVIGRITGATDSDSERGAAHLSGGNAAPLAAAPSGVLTAPTGPVPSPAPAAAATRQLTIAPDAGQTVTGRIVNAAPSTEAAAPDASRQPAQPLAQQKAQSKALPGPRLDQAQASRRHDGSHSSGSNPVAAMLTDQLVKESAKPDPALPMPTGVTVPLSTERSAPSVPPSVGSAMTDELVRESSKVTPTPQPAPTPPVKPQ